MAYILAFCRNDWFWLGIWVFYYLKFTNYAGIGIIETVLILTMTITEIPTGAIADLFGKKKTLFLSYLLLGLGNIGMGLAPSFFVLAAAVFVCAVGLSLGSGTLEALVYDSLKQDGLAAQYDKKIANINTIQLIAIAVCGAMGGFMYKFSPGIPFYATGIFYLLGGAAAALLTEPKIDTAKFSVRNYLRQIKEGVGQLFKTPDITRTTVLLLSVGLVVVITDEMLNSFLGVEFGYSEVAIGILWAIIFLVSAVASQFIPIINKKLGEIKAVILTGTIIAVTLFISPWLGFLAGGLTLLIRNSFQSMYIGLASVAINNSTESKYRTTTLSAFNMIKNIPYVLGAYLFGSLADKYSAKNTAFYLGAILLVLLTIQALVNGFRKKHL